MLIACQKNLLKTFLKKGMKTIVSHSPKFCPNFKSVDDIKLLFTFCIIKHCNKLINIDIIEKMSFGSSFLTSKSTVKNTTLQQTDHIESALF